MEIGARGLLGGGSWEDSGPVVGHEMLCVPGWAVEWVPLWQIPLAVYSNLKGWFLKIICITQGPSNFKSQGPK